MDDRARRHLLAAGLACTVYLAVWALVRSASLTYDEAVYVDLASHPLSSSYYPEDPFLRHPPLGILLLAGHLALEVPARLFPVPFTLGGIALLSLALHRADASPWPVLVPVLALPALVPLISVSMYPVLFLLVSLAAWARVARRRGLELVGWNLAALTHELTVLLLAVILVPVLVRRVRQGAGVLRGTLRTAVPYPAAVGWGLLSLALLVSGGEHRALTILDHAEEGSSTVGEILALKAVHTGVLVLVFAPVAPFLLSWRGEPWDRGMRVSAFVAIVAAPFYRYLTVLLAPVLVQGWRGPDRPRGRAAFALVVLPALLSTTLSGALILSGTDIVNDADLPGLVDHEAATALVAPGETVLLRSVPALAHTLGEEGYRVVSTGPHGPSTLTLERGQDRIVLVRIESKGEARAAPPGTVVLVPASWDGVLLDLTSRGWLRDDERGGLVRLAPDGGGG